MIIFFKSYTSNNNKLYILRNEKENKMYQMDWGKSYNNYYNYPNFMDEEDKKIEINTFLSLNLPENLLKSIIDSSGNSVYYYIKNFELAVKKIKEENKDINKKNEEKIGKQEELFIKDWQIKKYNVFNKENLQKEGLDANSFIKKISFYSSYRINEILRKGNKEGVLYLNNLLNIKNTDTILQNFKQDKLKDEDLNFIKKYSFYIFTNKEKKFIYINNTTIDKIEGKSKIHKFSLYEIKDGEPYKYIDQAEFFKLNISPEIKKIINSDVNENFVNKLEEIRNKKKKHLLIKNFI